MGAFLSVRALHEEGLAKKAIARRLGLDVRTVRRYVRRIEAGAKAPKRAPVPTKLDRFQELIEAKVAQGLSAVQIHQDLSGRPDFDASYESVKLRVRALRRTAPEVYCRMRYAPGEEAQIDFGDIGRIPDGGRRRTVHLFVMTLCHSRQAYYELVLDQRVPTFLGALRRAFEFFGGAPRRVKPDNLRSAVLIDALGQRYYQEDFFRLCRHYGTVPDAARPATPTDKGRTERDIGYAKGNAFRGRSFRSVEEARTHLRRWRDEVANVRTHGTTRRRPVDLFAEERSHLSPLPAEPYEIAEWGLYRVRKDCHIHVLGNYYSVPHPWVGKRVLVRLTEAKVTVFVEGEQVASHERAQGTGQDVTDRTHYPETKRVSSQEIHRRRLLDVRGAGAHAARFVHELREGPWVFGDQLNQMARLLETHGAPALDRACERALFFGATQGTRPLKRILEGGFERLPLPHEDAHRRSSESDFGRPLTEYAALLAGEPVEVGA
jgi:transposase